MNDRKAFAERNLFAPADIVDLGIEISRHWVLVINI